MNVTGVDFIAIPTQDFEHVGVEQIGRAHV